MSVVEDILFMFSNRSGAYRIARARMSSYEGPVRGQQRRTLQTSSDSVIRVTLSRLRARGLMKREKGIWSITEKGKKFLTEKLQLHRRRTRSNGPKTMIVAFDIPEKRKRARQWLRGELRWLGFKMLQKSMWFGPTPLPKEFVQVLGKMGILPYIRFFKAEEWDVV